MSVQHAGRWFLACLMIVAFATTARAAPDRVLWKYKGGYFAKNAKEDKWVEQAGDKKVFFIEQARTDEYVELYDKDRDLTVRLYADRQEDKTGKKDFHKVHKGAWYGQ